jgi:hypothetical protein
MWVGVFFSHNTHTHTKKTKSSHNSMEFTKIKRCKCHYHIISGLTFKMFESVDISKREGVSKGDKRVVFLFILISASVSTFS